MDQVRVLETRRKSAEANTQRESSPSCPIVEPAICTPEHSHPADEPRRSPRPLVRDLPRCAGVDTVGRPGREACLAAKLLGLFPPLTDRKRWLPFQIARGGLRSTFRRSRGLLPADTAQHWPW